MITRFHQQDHWVHLKCTNLPTSRHYTNSWKCALHKSNTNSQTTPPLSQSTITTTQTPHTPPTTQSSTPNTRASKNPTTLRILQLNIGGINNKLHELETTIKQHNIDIILLQETLLQTKHRTPTLTGYTPIRRDRHYNTQNKGGGLITYIKNNITFTTIQTPAIFTPTPIEFQAFRIHLTRHKTITISNTYIPPRNTTSHFHQNEDTNIETCVQHILDLPNSLMAGDFNAHSQLWHSHLQDHRGSLITELIQNSDLVTLNTNTL